jgi:hypothetical protein
MLRGLKKPRNFLVLIILLSVPVLSGYLLYLDLADDDLFSLDLKFENPDVDDLFLASDCQNNLKLFGSIGLSALFHVFLMETSVFEQLSLFHSQASFLDQNALVLRC